MIITKASHIDHLHGKVLALLMRELGDETTEELVIKRIEVDIELEVDLVGPIVGLPPVDESRVVYDYRGDRKYKSRLLRHTVPRPWVTYVTVVYGPHEGETVLYTAYAGPEAPEEPTDPRLNGMPVEVRKESEDFWSEHALVERL